MNDQLMIFQCCTSVGAVRGAVRGAVSGNGFLFLFLSLKITNWISHTRMHHVTHMNESTAPTEIQHRNITNSTNRSSTHWVIPMSRTKYHKTKNHELNMPDCTAMHDLAERSSVKSHMNESCLTYAWVMCPIRICRLICEWAMSHVWISHVAHRVWLEPWQRD